MSVRIWQPVACCCSSECAALLAAGSFNQPACTAASWTLYQPVQDRASSCAWLCCPETRQVQVRAPLLCCAASAHTAVSVLCQQWELADKRHVLCRAFPPPPVSNKKAELAASALGLQAVITFRAYPSQVSGTRSFSREHSSRERESSRGTCSRQHSGRDSDSSRASGTLGHAISSPVPQPGAQTALP